MRSSPLAVPAGPGLRLLIRHTTAADGNLALHTAGTDPERRTAIANRRAVLATLGLTLDDLVVGEQVHGTRLQRITDADRGRGAREAGDAFPATDGLATAEPGIALMALQADCPLVCLFDPAAPAIAIVHAGWRGLHAGILEEGVAALGAPPGRLRAYMAPAAGPCCYEVGDDLARNFPAAAVLRIPTRPRPHLDLRAAVALRLGLPVTLLDRACTICDERLFSHRRNGTPARQALLATLLPETRIP